MDPRWYLAQVNLFRVLSEAELEELERIIQMRTAPKGSLIMEPDRPTKVIYFIKQGHVRLYKPGPDGRPFVVAILGPGNLFGETEAFSTGTTTARLREAEARLRELAYERVERRLLYLLLRLAEQFGRRRGELVCLGVRLTHEELAAMIGSTRETVTATLSGLARRGVLRRGRGDLCLHLTRIVQDPEPGTLGLSSPDDGPSTSR